MYNFGREDNANREALQRLVASVTRLLDPGAALAAVADGLEFTESRPLGGTWALDALWSRLGMGKEMRRLLKGRRLDDSAERVLFAWSPAGRWPRRPSWPPPAGSACGVQNSAVGADLGFYAARSYSLMRPPRMGQRWIRFRERSATGWSGRGGWSWRLRWGRRPL